MTENYIGQYFTKRPIWKTKKIISFINECSFTTVVDPFAGGGDLLKEFSDFVTKGFDIDPTLGWQENDSLKAIPKYSDDVICITNPPYLASNSATRSKIGGTDQYFEDNPDLQDLYLIGIKQCLESFSNIVAIIPETFLLTGKFQDRLAFVNCVEDNPFENTTCPVSVVGWSKNQTTDFPVYKNDDYVGNWSNIKTKIPNIAVFGLGDIKFNYIDGELGLIGVDGTSPSDRIRFCNPSEIGSDEIKVSSRSRTRIFLEMDFNLNMEMVIDECNKVLNKLRDDTQDIILAPFKSNNKDGKRRRRLDFKIAKAIISKAIANLT